MKNVRLCFASLMVSTAVLAGCGGGGGGTDTGSLPDAGAMDASADTATADSAAADGATGDSSADDAAADSATGDGSFVDALPGDGAAPCQPGTCRLGNDRPCEMPSGPLGNGCCECTGDVCTNPCRCLAADTPIATPRGEVPVSELAVGDLVYSVHAGQIDAVPIAQVSRVRAVDHRVVRIRLESGRELFVSPRHPLADGRDVLTLAAGAELEGGRVLAAELVPYAGEYTHDILPASDTGSYYAGGVRLGSTLAR